MTDASIHIGVMSNPFKPVLSNALRTFYQQTANNAIDVSYVYGDRIFGTLYDPPPSKRALRRLKAAHDSKDAFVVQAYEKLPHVGKVVEKSAAWWQAASRGSRYKYICKTDDDTVINLQLLADALHKIPKSAEFVMSGYIRWRGWNESSYSACGGNWGGADLAYQTLCRGASGPFPYAVGALTCLSTPLAKRLATNQHFKSFLKGASERLYSGEPCHERSECAKAPPDRRYWHHEDAAIAFNLLEAAKDVSVHVISLPRVMHWFDHTRSYSWQPKTIYVHNAKTQFVFNKIASAYFNTTHLPTEKVDCSHCSKWGWTKYKTRENGLMLTRDVLWKCCFME